MALRLVSPLGSSGKSRDAGIDSTGPTGGAGGGGLGQLDSGKGFGGGWFTKPVLHVSSRVQTACPHDFDSVGLKTLAHGSDALGLQSPEGQFSAVPRR